MERKLLDLNVIGVRVFVLVCLISGSNPAHARANTCTMFNQVVREAHRRTKLPIRLPLNYCRELRRQAGMPHFAVQVAASKTRYDISLGEAGCPGATACHYGTFSGERIAHNQMLTVPDGKRIQLTPHQAAWLYDGSTCASGCDTVLTWRQDGVQYAVAIKVGPVGFVKKLALDCMRRSAL